MYDRFRRRGADGLEFELFLGHAFLVGARTVGGEDVHALVSLAELLGGRGDGAVGRVDPLALHDVLLSRARALLLLAHLDLQFFVALAVLVGSTVGGELPVFSFLFGVFRAGALRAHHCRGDSFVAYTDFGDHGTVLGEESLVLGDLLLIRTGAGGFQFFQFVALTVDWVGCMAFRLHQAIFLLLVLLVRTGARSLELLFFVTHTVDGGNLGAMGRKKVVFLVLARRFGARARGHQTFLLEAGTYGLVGTGRLTVGVHESLVLGLQLLFGTRARSLELLILVTHTVDGISFTMGGEQTVLGCYFFLSTTRARSLELLFSVADTVLLGTIGLVELDFLVLIAGADDVGIFTVGNVPPLVFRLLFVSLAN